MRAPGRSLRSSPIDPADRRTALFVGLAALLLLLPGVPFGLPFSVGIPGALRLLDGQLPYRDFWTMYAPGHFGLLAALFSVFGRQLLVAAIAAVLLEAVAAALLFRLARSAGANRSWAAAAGLAFAVALFKTAPTVTSYSPALVLMLVGWERVLRLGEPGIGTAPAGAKLRTAWSAGACFGLAAWFKHDVAAYACVAGLCATAAAAGGSMRRGLLLRIVAGAGVALAPVILIVAITAGRDAWRDLVIFPLTDFPASRPEKYPALVESFARAKSVIGRAGALLTWLAHWVPAWTSAALVVVTVWRFRSLPPRSRAAAVGGLVALLLFFAAAHVQVNTHLTTMTAIVLVVAAVFGAVRSGGEPGRDRVPRSRSRAAAGCNVALCAGALVYLAALAVEGARDAAKALDLLRQGRTLAVPGALGVLVAERDAAWLEPLVQSVRELTRPDEPIYVGVARHDALLTCKPLLYLFLGRRNATRYDELHPAVVDREPVQREMLTDLEQSQVRVIVLWHVGLPTERFDALRDERARTLPGTGATLLDREIAARYVSRARFGEFEVLTRER